MNVNVLSEHIDNIDNDQNTENSKDEMVHDTNMSLTPIHSLNKSESAVLEVLDFSCEARPQNSNMDNQCKLKAQA